MNKNGLKMGKYVNAVSTCCATLNRAIASGYDMKARPGPFRTT